MDAKDWLIIGLLLLVVGGPVAMHLHHRGKGRARRGPQSGEFPIGELPLNERPPGGHAITDEKRLGEGVAAVGGKTIVQGARLLKMGTLRFAASEEAAKQQQVGGA